MILIGLSFLNADVRLFNGIPKLCVWGVNVPLWLLLNSSKRIFELVD